MGPLERHIKLKSKQRRDPIEDRIRQEMKLLQLDEPSDDFLNYIKGETESIYHPQYQDEFGLFYSSVAGTGVYKYSCSFSPPSIYNWGNDVKDSQPFETNMMEALIGWRSWKISYDKKLLMSQNAGGADDCYWYPDKHLVAECSRKNVPNAYDPCGVMNPLPSHESPAEFCTCGIYAKDVLEYLGTDYPGIYGQVYGWGRYVRGDKGFRCQYAYPKQFYVTRDKSPDVIEILKQYHVPIYIEQPVLLYNPEEDGYEHRQDDENWNFRAIEDTDADEDPATGEDDEA